MKSGLRQILKNMRNNNPDYSVRQLLEMGACTNCRLCADVCPAVSASGRGDLSAITRMRGLKNVLNSRMGLLGRLLGRKATPSKKDLEAFSDTVFSCTLCGNCQEVCPVGIHLKDLWVSLRQDLVHSNCYPAKINMIRKNLQDSKNVFAEDNEERADWVEDMSAPPENGYIRDRADLVYFTGCTAAYFPVAQKIPIALAEVLDAAAVSFTLLGEEEWCCGFPMIGAGIKDMFAPFKEHNLEAVREKGAKKVVFACPSCYQMWREHYPAAFEIAHTTQFLNELIKGNRIPFKPLPLTVTYHDPCDLGRGARVFDEPREIIQSIPGVKLVELSRIREDCQCCGGGGNLEMIDAGLSAKIAEAKIKEIINTGAQAVVTSCQQCVRTMLTYVRRNKVPIEVLDIAQLVNRALQKDSD